MEIPNQYKGEGFEGQRYFVLPQSRREQLARHPLCRALYFTDIGYFPFARHHYRSRSEGSLEYILIYCVRGEGWYELGEERHTIHAGQLFILPPGKPHRYGADAQHPWTIYWVHFLGQSAADFHRYLTEKSARISAPQQENRTDWFEEILRQLEVITQENLVYACSCLQAFLASFKNTSMPSSREPDAVSVSVAYMKKNLHRRLTLSEFAQKAGLSVSHYSSLFREKMQTSPIKYFNFLKIQEACYLLQSTSKQVKEIASTLGFDDPYYFSRLFSQVMGVSPKEYREQWR